MEKTNNIALFDQAIETLTEVKTVRELIDSGEDVKNFINRDFTKVNVIFRKQPIRNSSDYSYRMTVNLHPNIDMVVDNRKIINNTEFILIAMTLGIPVDSTELKFKAYARFIKGVSDSNKIKSEDKSFVRFELFIHPELSPVSCFLDSGTRLAMNRLSLLSDEKLKAIHAEKLANYKLFSVSKKFKDELDEIDNEGE